MLKTKMGDLRHFCYISCFLLNLINFAHCLIEVTTIVLKPVSVSETLWNSEMVTTTFTANEKTRLGCILACNQMSNCNAFEYNLASSECKISSRMHQWVVASEGSTNIKPIYMKLDAIGEPKVSRFDLRTGTGADDKGGAFCNLYFRVCLEDNVSCCDSKVLDGPDNDYESGTLDVYESAAVLDECKDFIVPDYRIAHIYVRHTGIDGWGGDYVNLWFDANAWFVRCVNPAGGKILLDNTAILEVECSPGDLANP